jgi:hypothetical protein
MRVGYGKNVQAAQAVRQAWTRSARVRRCSSWPFVGGKHDPDACARRWPRARPGAGDRRLGGRRHLARAGFGYGGFELGLIASTTPTRCPR